MAPRASSGGAAALGPAQSLRQVGRATDPLGHGCPHWLLVGASLFFFLVWISTLPCRGVLSNEKWQELQVQSSQSPQDLRTPGRHWSLMALSSLLPFPLKETAAPGAQGTLQVSVRGCSFQEPLLSAGSGSLPLALPTGPPTIYSVHPRGSRQCLPGKPRQVAALLQSVATKTLQVRHGGNKHFWKKDTQPRCLIFLENQGWGSQGCIKIGCTVCPLI